MYVIGERINGMFKSVRGAIEEGDKRVIHELALAQINAGADALDINVGPAKGDALGSLHWLIDTVREVTDVPLSIDNPKWAIQQDVIPRLGSGAIINSCKADPEILDKYMALAVEHGAGLVALTIDKQGVPADIEKRVELGAQIGA
ncbi:MAG: dihydropteroate synthase, partial [Candidatus Hydrogenedentes bacterium]|nr:dihydropteroate synthase [Candidatus Hydrogenedentota bacterium]